jgi:miniconductance mechanosensitive channel
MIQQLYKYLLDLFRDHPFFDVMAKPFAATLAFIALLLVAWFVLLVARFVILKIARRIAHRTQTEWDDIIIKRKVIHSLAHLIPAFILYHSAHFAEPSFPFQSSPEVLSKLSDQYYFQLGGIILKWVKVYFIVVAIFIINTVLNAVNDIYQTTEYSHHRSIKGYIQLFKILVYFLSAILVISFILGKDPTVLVAGLGAMAAVLLLVFKDTILGFVASIQLSANDMLKIGDWIEMPGHRADGTVMDITLNTVKVQNWDRTITTIPTYALVSESFNNWKGMEESGGRRIKRAIYIDVTSIRFCDGEMLRKFAKFELIRDYVEKKELEVLTYNREHNITDDDMISGRRQTNVGIFRKYLEYYLRNNTKIRQDMTFIVRQLQPSDKGLPIEIYVFSKEIAWVNYENLQSDIFDHIFAVVPEFGLKVFQVPSGNDLKMVVETLKAE